MGPFQAPGPESVKEHRMDWESNADESVASKNQIMNLWQKELQLLQSAAALRVRGFECESEFCFYVFFI